MAVDRIEVTQQCHSSIAARRPPEPANLGYTREKYFACTNFRGLGTNRENSENLSHAKINTTMVLIL